MKRTVKPHSATNAFAYCEYLGSLPANDSSNIQNHSTEGMRLTHFLLSSLYPPRQCLPLSFSCTPILTRMLSRRPALEQPDPPAAKRHCCDPAIATMSTPAIPTTTIVLTPEEERVRRLLVDVAAEIDSGRTEHNEPLLLRFTGGWVRDKLIGQQSHDIDVGINKMTGFDFATRLQEFLAKHNDAYDIPTHSIYKVESNPEKSKHLETATTKILSLDIDFVNLRSERYTNDSRIPQMVRSQVVPTVQMCC
jgi:hypothetical protein